MSTDPGVRTRFEEARLAYFSLIMDGQRRAALDLALGLMASGLPAQDVLTHVVAPAQSAVGRAWQAARATIAQEHRASGITEYVVAAVADEAMLAPGAPAEGSAGVAVIACAEGEWHVLPGRMAAAVMRMHGFEVSFIGPSVPASDLALLLADDPPTAVAVTAVMPLTLAGAWRTISELRALGTRIVAGGRGFGPAGRWAVPVGADHWAPDFASGARLMAEALSRPALPPRPPGGSPATIAETQRIDLDFESLVEAATSRALAMWPALRTRASALRATRQDLAATLRAVAAAVLVGDDDVLIDYIGWFEDVLAARSLPLGYVPTGLQLLAEQLPEQAPRARALALRGLAHCQRAPMLPSDPVI